MVSVAMGEEMVIESFERALEEARARVQEAERVLVLTGAGISAESGVPTFRGPDGLWRTFRPEELANPSAFARDAVLVWEWYLWRRQRIATCQPNAAHCALVILESRVPGFLLATQNVDGLHALAGSRHLVELHGNIWRVRCGRCGAISVDRRQAFEALPPLCACGGILRPDIVWFGEALPEPAVRAALDAARHADVVLVIGTSSIVYPAAALPNVARREGAYVIEINPEPTPLTPETDVALRGKAAEVLPVLVGEPS